MAVTLGSLISARNLHLGWRRIVTAVNIQYKRFFRPLIEAYEVGLEQNLQHLRERLRGGWEPSAPMKIYLPKPSGLQRPISLLGLENQILLQAVANIVAAKVWDRRKKLEGSVAFSSLLNSDRSSIFFLQRWGASYRRFQLKIRRSFISGGRWVAHFDLAAFYDTISHDGLARIVAPRSHDNALWRKIKQWLQT